MRWHTLRAAITASILVQPSLAVDYTAGIRFDDGSSYTEIGPSETATLELFITTNDASALMKEFLIGFSASTVGVGGTDLDLAFVRPFEQLLGWDYGGSRLDGPLSSRFSTAQALSDSDYVSGPFTELVVDSFVIDPVPSVYDEDITYVIEPNLQNFDIIIADAGDPSPGSFLDPSFGSVTLVVPEPSSAALLGLGCLALLRRRR